MYFLAYSLSDFRLAPLVNYLIYSLFIFEYAYKKAVVSLNAAPLSIQTRCICTKKSGTALLLFRYLRLSLCLNI